MHEQILDVIIAVASAVSILGGLTLYLYCVIDIHRQKVKYQSERSVWLNLIWAAPVIGCLLYLANRKHIGPKASGRF